MLKSTNFLNSFCVVPIQYWKSFYLIFLYCKFFIILMILKFQDIPEKQMLTFG